MKKVLLFTVVMLLLISTVVMAHSPQKLELNFNMETHILNVEFTHNVGGENTNHYIDKITIMVNGNEVITQIPGQQLENIEIFSYYMPGLSNGDEVEVMANCSFSGDRSVKKIIGE